MLLLHAYATIFSNGIANISRQLYARIWALGKSGNQGVNDNYEPPSWTC